jgi:hypothetical protein
VLAYTICCHKKKQKKRIGSSSPLAQPQNPKPLGLKGPIYLGAYSNPIDFALQKIELEEGKAMLFYH